MITKLFKMLVGLSCFQVLLMLILWASKEAPLIYPMAWTLSIMTGVTTVLTMLILWAGIKKAAALVVKHG